MNGPSGILTEVDDGYPQQVQRGKEEVGPVLELVEHDGVDQHRPADADGPAGDAEAVALGAHVRGPDLGRDQEGDRAPRRRVADVEEEQHRHGGRREGGRLVRVVPRALVHARGDEVDGEQAEGAEHEALAPAEAVDDLRADDGADDSNRAQAAGQPVLGQRVVSGRGEEDGGVGRHGRDAGPGGHDLQDEAEPGPAAELVARLPAPAGQDLGELHGGALLALLGDGGDLCEFLLDLGAVTAAYVFEDLSRVVHTPDRGQVPGAVWEELDAGEEEEGGEALEGQQEAPPHVRVAAVDEGEAEGQPVGHGDAEVVGDEDVAEVAASVAGRRGLGDEDGRDAGQRTRADTRDYANDENEVAGLCGGLEGTADEGEESSDEETTCWPGLASRLPATGSCRCQ